MLTSTYIHVPGIGKSLEKTIWESGHHTWDDFLENMDNIAISSSKKTKLNMMIPESKIHLKHNDFEYFARHLPAAEHWRAFRHFEHSVAYLDIETTGLSPSYSTITVIGLYDGKHVKSYVKGINLEEIVDDIQKYGLIVTFNGARFDLPFIKQQFPQITFNQLHIDLMYPLRRIGLSGGLKAIEQKLGIQRNDRIFGITGRDAVQLWYDYKNGNEKALDSLLEYNREDIVNLETIINKTYRQFIMTTIQNTFKNGV